MCFLQKGLISLTLRTELPEQMQLSLVLNLVEKNDWSTVGITAYEEGDQRDFNNFLKTIVVRRPIWSRLFHLQDDDFSGLKKQMTLESKKE